MAIDATNALTTLAAAKVWVAIASAVTTYDTLIELYIDAVCAQFNKYTKRQLKSRTLTEYYEGNGTPDLYTKEYPITSITSIHIDTDRAYGAATLIDSSKYVSYDDGKIHLDQNTFSASAKANKIVYVAGYTTIPNDLVMAVSDQIKWMFRKHLANQEGIQVETQIGGSTTLTEEGEILTSSLEILKRYKRKDHI